MQNLISQVFSKVIEEYIEIFSSFYPGKGHAGFNESNQVSMFLSNYRILRSKSITWMELSFGGKTGRLDGIIIDREFDSVIYIEAKRLNKSSKIDELKCDFLRVLNADNRKALLSTEDNLRNEYVLLLADIWDERNFKSEWIDKWVENNPILDSVEFFKKTENFSVIQHRIYSFAESGISDTLDKYNLAYSLFRIR